VHTLIVSKDGYGIGSKEVTIQENKTTDITSSPITLQRKLLTGKISLSGDLSGANVALVGSDVPAVVTNSNGNFTFYGVGKGNYQLQVSKSGYITKTIPLSITTDNGYEIPYTIDVQESFGKITGTATLDGYASHSGILIKLKNTSYQTYTDASGRYTLNVPAKNYPDGMVISKELFDSKTITSTITVTEKGSYEAQPISLTQTAKNLKGKIIVIGKDDYSKATILVEGTSGSAKGASATANPNSDGSFEIKSLPLGLYSYTISYPDKLHETIVGSFELKAGSLEYGLGEMTLRTSYVVINQNATYTNSRDVTLSIGSTDAAYMQIVEGGTTYDK